jgi:hypothetical protein
MPTNKLTEADLSSQAFFPPDRPESSATGRHPQHLHFVTKVHSITNYIQEGAAIVWQAVS